MNDQLLNDLSTEGYMNLKEIQGRGICGLFRFIFTVGLCSGINENSYDERWCYPSISDAREALKNWNGLQDPPGNWIKHKGRGGDYSNPNKENYGTGQSYAG